MASVVHLRREEICLRHCLLDARHFVRSVADHTLGDGIVALLDGGRSCHSHVQHWPLVGLVPLIG